MYFSKTWGCLSNPVERNVTRPSCMVGGVPTINTAISHCFLMTAIVCNDFQAASVEASRGVRNKDGESMGSSPFVARRFHGRHAHVDMAAMGTLISPTRVAEHPLTADDSLHFLMLTLVKVLTYSQWNYDCVWFIGPLWLLMKHHHCWCSCKVCQAGSHNGQWFEKSKLNRVHVVSIQKPVVHHQEWWLMIICCPIFVYQCLLPVLTSGLDVVLISYRDCCCCWSLSFLLLSSMPSLLLQLVFALDYNTKQDFVWCVCFKQLDVVFGWCQFMLCPLLQCCS